MWGKKKDKKIEIVKEDKIKEKNLGFSLSVLKPIISIFMLLIFSLFFAFNVSYKTDLSLIFTKFKDVPLVIIMVFCFATGSLFSAFLFLKTLRKQKKTKNSK